MNAVPHIGSTLKQRALLRYQLLQHELETERRERIHAALQVDALLDRVSQPEPCQFCAVEEDPAVSPWIFWPAIVGFSLILTFASYEFATRLLPTLRGWLS